MQNKSSAIFCFDKAKECIEYHLGPYHPLNSTIYSTLSNIYKKRSQYKDALVLLTYSLKICIRSLGTNHIHTAEVYRDMAEIYARNK